MEKAHWLVSKSVDHYRSATLVIVIVTLLFALLAGVPSLWPRAFQWLNPITVDTDPENMLSKDEAVRIFHNRMKKVFSLHDMVVLGIVNEEAKEGVFNPGSLRKIYDLTEYARTLRGKDIGEPPGEGVVEVDLIAPSTVDSIEPGGAGVIKFEWLMKTPPGTPEEAREIRRKAQRIPFLNGTLVSEDGKAIAIYLPLTRKDLSYKISSRLREKIESFEGSEQYYITGLPVAEDTFGVEMFVQMGISAPLAMLIIFILMILFFRKIIVIIPSLIVALMSVIFTMGALIISGYPVHIMSSMIPIFIMPIAVLDSIHIISEFFELYQETRDKRQTIRKVLYILFKPMLYTSLTSAAGFASLALTPTPPVQVFGVFVAFGIMVAWLLTVTFIPAFLMFISPKRLEDFGAARTVAEAEVSTGGLGKFLHILGSVTYHRAKLIIGVTIAVIGISAYGMSRIEINDNPIKWFTRSHPIRVADTVLNRHFGGTYMAYLVLSPVEKKFDPERTLNELARKAEERAVSLKEDLPSGPGVFQELVLLAGGEMKKAQSRDEFFKAMDRVVRQKAELAEGESAFSWEEAGLFLDEQRQLSQIFKDPDLLRYQERLQEAMKRTGIVGKSNSLADIVKTVYRDLVSGNDPGEQAKNFRIPDRRRIVAECLIQFQNSHRPGDLWHFVTPDYRTSSIWVQLRSGDNKDMALVARAVDEFMASNPPPVPVKHQWFGLTYINVIWQRKMVAGMLQAFLGSFLVVFLLMTILFRSALWGLLSMVPLTVTIGAIYGAVGLIGKDYDMPVAVLSSLTLGLAVDFAIHFLARGRAMYENVGSWKEAALCVFGEPARAIARNVIVIAVGFLPLLFAPLVPYKTVGILMATILLLSGISTFFLLPSLSRILEKRLFLPGKVMGPTCNCVTCLVSSLALVALVALNLHQYARVGWSTLTWISLIAIPFIALGCGILSRREKCKFSPDQ
ncbi:MAG: MMPL family transporter [Deltaproteobacteria bacterium]|nr:MMPL family transporter [Deltaproteobacteria bacterium]